MTDIKSDYFDIFDLFGVLIKFRLKIFFFTLIYFLLIYFTPNILSKYHYDKEMHIEIFIENDIHLPNKYNALSNFLTFKNNKIYTSLLKTKLIENEYNFNFFVRHIYGLPLMIDNEFLSNEFVAFFYNTNLKSVKKNTVTLLNTNNQSIAISDNEFIQNLIENLNLRMHMSLVELMNNINKDIRDLAEISEALGQSNANLFPMNGQFLKSIYDQNLKTINNFKNSGVENYFLIKDIRIATKKISSIRYYLVSIILYLFLISFSSILLLGYQYKKTH